MGGGETFGRTEDDFDRGSKFTPWNRCMDRDNHRNVTASVNVSGVVASDFD